MEIRVIDHQEYDFADLIAGGIATLDIGGIIDTSGHRSALLAFKVHEADIVGGSGTDAMVDVSLDAVWPDAGERSRRFRDSTVLTYAEFTSGSSAPWYGRSGAVTDTLGPAVSVSLKATQKGTTAATVFRVKLSVSLILLD